MNNHKNTYWQHIAKVQIYKKRYKHRNTNKNELKSIYENEYENADKTRTRNNKNQMRQLTTT